MPLYLIVNFTKPRCSPCQVLNNGYAIVNLSLTVSKESDRPGKMLQEERQYLIELCMKKRRQHQPGHNMEGR